MKSDKLPRMLWGILGFTLLTRIILAFLAKNPYLEDSHLYFWSAQYIKTDGFFHFPPDAHPYVQLRTPVYALLLLCLLSIHSITSVSIGLLGGVFNAFLYTACIFFLFRILHRFLGKRPALIAAGFATILPSGIPYSVALMPETLALFFWLAGWVALTWKKEPTIGSTILCGIFFSLAALTKPIFVWSEAVPLLTLLYLSLRNRLYLKLAVIQCFAFVLTSSPLLYRNWKLWGQITFSPQAGINLWDVERHKLLAAVGIRTTDSVTTPLGKFSDPRIPQTAEEVQRKLGFDWENIGKRASYLGKLTVEDILKYKDVFFLNWIKQYPRLYIGTATGALADLLGFPKSIPQPFSINFLVTPWGVVQCISLMIEWGLYALALYGLFFGWRTLSPAFLFGGLLSALYFSVAIITMTHTRYRFPMLPTLVAFAGLGLDTLLRQKTINRILAHPLLNRQIPLDSPEMITIHRKIIESKSLLRRVYRAWYTDFANAMAPDPKKSLLSIEIGSGASHLDEFIPNLIKTDVVPHPNVHRVALAESLPFGDSTVGNIFLTNVLHHIPAPRLFFQEAQRVLADGGRIVMLEPANSLLTRLIFGNLHASEVWDYSVKDWETMNSSRLCSANMAIPAIIFERDRDIFEKEFPRLHIRSIRRHTCFSYFLSGGVSVRELTPRWLATGIWKFDCLLCKIFPSWGSQMTIELEKSEPQTARSIDSGFVSQLVTEKF